MVLTINSRGYLCLNHPPVIISTDLIFLFLFSSLQSGAGKAWLQDGDVIAADKPFQHTTNMDMDFYIWILLTDHTQPDNIWGCWFVSLFCKKYGSKVFGQNISFECIYWPTTLQRFRWWHLEINTFAVVFAQHLQTDLSHVTWRVWIAFL